MAAAAEKDYGERFVDRRRPLSSRCCTISNNLSLFNKERSYINIVIHVMCIVNESNKREEEKQNEIKADRFKKSFFFQI